MHGPRRRDCPAAKKAHVAVAYFGIDKGKLGGWVSSLNPWGCQSVWYVATSSAGWTSCLELLTLDAVI